MLEEGAVSRDIYLPRGQWRDEANPEHPVYNGPTWISEEQFVVTNTALISFKGRCTYDVCSETGEGVGQFLTEEERLR